MADKTASSKDVIGFFPSQVALAVDNQDEPPPYTASPLVLLWENVRLFLRYAPSIGGILWPWVVWDADFRDELYLYDWGNIVSIVLHIVLIVAQVLFLASWVFALSVPLVGCVAWAIVFAVFNASVCRILNGDATGLQSQVPVENEDRYAGEYWIYINGVAAGRHWLQSNVDRLSETFGRRIHGVHNPTYGIIFDVVECLIQRGLGYATQDVRNGYVLVKKAILDTRYSKVVLVLHSQGGIEGSLIVDWLLAEVPRDLLGRLEIYTFGNAANHFNNPQNSPRCRGADGTGRAGARARDVAIRHIEHYANSGDFVARFGVLTYMHTAKRFMGRVFQSPNSGHLLNQHYLHQMFPLTADRKAREDNPFMNMEVSFSEEVQETLLRETVVTSVIDVADRMGEAGVTFVGDVNSPVSISSPSSPVDRERISRKLVVGDLSRLWRYRNGRTPDH